MSLHCDHCGAEVDATVRFDEDDDRGIWLRCTDPKCDKSGRFAGDDIRVVDKGRGVATDGGQATDPPWWWAHSWRCGWCGDVFTAFTKVSVKLRLLIHQLVRHRQEIREKYGGEAA